MVKILLFARHPQAKDDEKDDGFVWAVGLSTDERPISPTDGSLFYEQDTMRTFYAQGGTWQERLNPAYAVKP